MASLTKSKLHYSSYLLLILLLFHVGVVFLFFDPKMNVGGDDSDYIIAAHEFMLGHTFPSWHGSFYPIFLSFFMPLFEFNVVAYKMLSVVMTALHFIVFYKAFKLRLPQPVLLFALVITAFSWQLAFYASTTYSETLFLLLQACFFYVYFRIEDQLGNEKKTTVLLRWLLLAFIIFLMSITRNIGLGVMIALTLYLLLYRKWKECLLVLGFFIGFQIVFTLYKDFWWNFKGTGLEGEFQRIAYKDFYDPNKGSEDLIGFGKRFVFNSHTYLSNHLAIFFGFRDSGTLLLLPWLTAVFYSILLYSAWLSFKRNKAILLISIYIFVMMFVTFVVLQPHWYQERLILIYLPLIAISIGYFVYQNTNDRNTVLKTGGQIVLVLIPLIVVCRMMAAPKNIGVALLNISSDRNKFKGYDPDWRNYMEISEWAGKNIDSSRRILCRKPGLSTIYGKRSFIGISSFHYNAADSAVAFIERRKIDYVILDKLTLPTVQRLMAYYVQKRPLGVKSIKDIGVTKTARLLKLCKEDPVDDEDHLQRLLTGIEVAPESTYFYVIAGDKLFSMGRAEQAIQYYNKALALAPKDDRVMVRRGWAFMQTGKNKQAYDDISTIVRDHPENKKYADLLSEVKKRLLL